LIFSQLEFLFSLIAKQLQNNPNIFGLI